MAIILPRLNSRGRIIVVLCLVIPIALFSALYLMLSDLSHLSLKDRLSSPFFHKKHKDMTNVVNQEKVKGMLRHAWGGYKQYAWGFDELRPNTNGGKNWGEESFLFTPVDALDTLWIMGFKEEYLEAKELVLSTLDFSLKPDASFSAHNHFEITIRLLGGLLGAHEMDPDPRYIVLAKQLGDRLIQPLYQNSGLPPQQFNIKTGLASGNSACLASLGTIQLELQYLADITQNSTFQTKALAIYDVLHKLNEGERFPGLYPNDFLVGGDVPVFLEPKKYSIGPNADSFYEYLLKIWISTGEEKFKRMYEESREGLIKHLLNNKNGTYFFGEIELAPEYDMFGQSPTPVKRQSGKASQSFTEHPNVDVVLSRPKKNEGKKVDDWKAFLNQNQKPVEAASLHARSDRYNKGKLGDTFAHLSCFTGGMLSLGSITLKNKEWKRHLELGQEITETCFRSYLVGPSHLGGELSRVLENGEIITTNGDYLLRPEVIESIFYQWRFTHHQKYRDYGVLIIDALEEFTKTPSGYSSVGGRFQSDNMESFFFAETLKYLYLLFSDDEVVSLNDYVLNTEAHALSIRGHGLRKDSSHWMKI